NDDETRGDEEADDGVCQAIREGWTEDYGEPVLGKEAPVDDLVARRRLHPAVGGQDPERRKERSERNHEGGNEMRPRRHELASEQEYAEKSRLQEEGSDAFIGEQGAEDIRRRIGKAAPVRAELERHDHAGHHADPEGDRENPDPEHRDAEIDVSSGPEMKSFEDQDVGSHAYRESGHKNVPTNQPAKLQARENDRIELHDTRCSSRLAGLSGP